MVGFAAGILEIFAPPTSGATAKRRDGRVVQSGKLMFATIAVALAALLFASPGEGAAQAPFPDCVHCAWSEYPGSEWPSTMCVFDYWGHGECSQIGNAQQHRCRSWGGCPSSAMGAASDEEAVRMVMHGETLPGDGGHFFVADGDEIVVMRKCDNSHVARLPGDASRYTATAEQRGTERLATDDDWEIEP